MPRRPGPSARLRLTLSYAAAIVATGTALLAVVWVFLLRYVPRGNVVSVSPDGQTGFAPDRDDLVRAFVPPTVVMFALLVVVGVGVGWLLAGRMLRPLEQLHAAARQVAEGNLAHRVAMTGRSDEFRELADMVDRMLETLERHVEEQRRFAANASHELRTPLSITRALLDNADDDPATDVPQLLARLRQVNDREAALVEALLLLARSERAPARHEPADLALLAEEAVETLEPFATGHGVTLRADLGPADTTGDPALLGQLVSNLVHNAVVHNLAADGTVEVRTATDDAGALLVVENTGPALSAAAVATFTDAFQRGTRTTESTGVGLGLTIVAAIVSAHEGRLALAARPAGGLTVTVRLPRA